MIDHALATAIPVAQAMDGGDGMGWGIAMMAAMLVVTVLVVAGVIWLVRGAVRERKAPSSGDPAPESALQILERRYAAGEIDVDEYRERRSELLGAR